MGRSRDSTSVVLHYRQHLASKRCLLLIGTGMISISHKEKWDSNPSTGRLHTAGASVSTVSHHRDGGQLEEHRSPPQPLLSHQCNCKSAPSPAWDGRRVQCSHATASPSKTGGLLRACWERSGRDARGGQSTSCSVGTGLGGLWDPPGKENLPPTRLIFTDNTVQTCSFGDYVSGIGVSLINKPPAISFRSKPSILHANGHCLQANYYCSKWTVWCK